MYFHYYMHGDVSNGFKASTTLLRVIRDERVKEIKYRFHVTLIDKCVVARKKTFWQQRTFNIKFEKRCNKYDTFLISCFREFYFRNG